MRRPYRERFRLILSELGTGLAGPARGAERGHPPRPPGAARDQRRRSTILRRQNKVIRDFIRDADTVSRGGRARVSEAAGASWAQRGRGHRRRSRPRAASELGPLLEPPAALPGRAASPRWPSSSATADEQIPHAAQAARAPRPSSSASCATPSRSRATRAARSRALGERRRRRAAAPSASPSEEIGRAARARRRSRRGWASRCASSCRRSTTASARSRTTRRPRERAPPAPDKTAYKEGQGFTGMEALSTTSTARRSASTPSTRSATCCGSSLFTGGALLALLGQARPRPMQQAVHLLARPVPARRDQRPTRPASTGEPRAKERAQAREAASARRATPRRGRRRPRRPPKPGRARPLASRRSCCPTASRSCSTSSRKPADGDAAARSGGGPQGGRHRPTSSSTTSCAMSRRGPHQSIVASPVLVGAVTVLVAIVAVLLAYNANPGLPFVPTYDVKAELPGGSNLVEGNEVRVGGFRVGVVDRIRPASTPAPRRRPGPRRALDRGHRHEARQGARAAAGRHARSRSGRARRSA